MSKYSVNYKKITDGYNKIMSCIDTSSIIEQLECIPNMVDSWIKLTELYCEQTNQDKSDRYRKKNANNLAEMTAEMFEDIKEHYQYTVQSLSPKEYEGVFGPVRVKNLKEMIEDQMIEDQMS